MIAGAGLHEHRRVAARWRVSVTRHGLTDGLMDAERLAMKLVARAQFPVHLFGEMMEAGVVIIFAADDHDVIGCAVRDHGRCVCGVCHRVEEKLAPAAQRANKI